MVNHGLPWVICLTTFWFFPQLFLKNTQKYKKCNKRNTQKYHSVPCGPQSRYTFGYRSVNVWIVFPWCTDLNSLSLCVLMPQKSRFQPAVTHGTASILVPFGPWSWANFGFQSHLDFKSVNNPLLTLQKAPRATSKRLQISLKSRLEDVTFRTMFQPLLFFKSPLQIRPPYKIPTPTPRHPCEPRQGKITWARGCSFEILGFEHKIDRMFNLLRGSYNNT